MAELHLIGQVLDAVDFEEPNLFCKWAIQVGKVEFWKSVSQINFYSVLYVGPYWKVIEGNSDGETSIDRGRLESSSVFSSPIDLHLAVRSVQGWPKFFVEVYSVTPLDKYFPVGCGFVHIPTKA